MSASSEKMRVQSAPKPKRFSIWAMAGFALAVISGIVLALAGPGYRWGWWGLSAGFMAMQGALFIGLAAAALSLIGMIGARPGRSRKGLGLALAGLVIGAIMANVPWQAYRTAKSVPPIHDISTDTVNPPAFVAVLPLRGDKSNPSQYGGAEIAEQQRKAYPDIAPAPLALAPAQAFDRALEAARQLGWEIVAADPAQGRLEATDTTFWFGFKDDVVVRVTPEAGGSRIDARSVSRIGQSDLGANAKRIRKFLDTLKSMK